jgi:hypothetical protein
MYLEIWFLRNRGLSESIFEISGHRLNIFSNDKGGSMARLI